MIYGIWVEEKDTGKKRRVATWIGDLEYGLQVFEREAYIYGKEFAKIWGEKE